MGCVSICLFVPSSTLSTSGPGRLKGFIRNLLNGSDRRKGSGHSALTIFRVPSHQRHRTLPRRCTRLRGEAVSAVAEAASAAEEAQAAASEEAVEAAGKGYFFSLIIGTIPSYNDESSVVLYFKRALFSLFDFCFCIFSLFSSVDVN